jgi:hypothetical protein
VVEVEAEIEPEATAERQDRAHDARRTWTRELPDHMAEIGAHLDVLAAKRWNLDFDELVRAQRQLDRLDGVERSAAQREADVFAELPSRLVALIRALHSGDLEALTAVAALTPEQVAELRALTAEGATLEPEHDEPPADEAPSPVPDDAALLCGDEFEAALIGGVALAYDLEVAEVYLKVYGEPMPAAEESWLDSSPDWDAWLATLSEPPEEPPEPPDPPPPVEAPGPTWQELALQSLRLKPTAPISVVVHVPLSTALELDERAGRVDGTAPGGAALPARRCRLLLPAAALTRLVTNERGVPLLLDPTGTPPSGSRAAAETRSLLLSMISAAFVIEEAQPQHDPRPGLRMLVQLRDQRCTGIGCSAPARRCDLDHNQAWPEGPTASWNLWAKSDRCHHLKHDGWETHHDPDTGVTTWTSPVGHAYRSEAVWPRPTQGEALARLVDAYLAT